MVVFEINLIRDQAIPARKRRALFWATSLYLLACGALLAWGANQATRRLIAAAHARQEIAQLNARARLGLPARGDALLQSRALQRQITDCAERLESVDRVLASRLNLPAILNGLLAPLPNGVYVINFDLDGPKRELTFDVAVPIRGTAADVSAGSWWRSGTPTPGLMSHLTRIRSEFTQRHKLEEKPVFYMRFASALADGRWLRWTWVSTGETEPQSGPGRPSRPW